MILVTGGAGFIGSNFALDWVLAENEPILIVDKLTYAGNIENLATILNNPRVVFVKGDINDIALINELLDTHQPRAILNFAAESHVDRSINNPTDFIQTNINGTFSLLEAARKYWSALPQNLQTEFRFLQVSTDEVYGSLTPDEAPFDEQRAYSPNNPYSATKAAADHLVNSYFHTYKIPTLITNCSNNYGPYQFPEKLIPLTILNALQQKPLFIYGDGLQIRDWLYVTDHCSAIRKVLSAGTPGETYNIGGNNEITNLNVVKTICSILDKTKPAENKTSYASFITHIEDRPGHDRRYAINANKIASSLHWTPAESFESGIEKTVLWYLNHPTWISNAQNTKNYQQWLNTNYVDREII